MQDNDSVESASLASRFFRSPTVDATSTPTVHSLDENVVSETAESQSHTLEGIHEYSDHEKLSSAETTHNGASGVSAGTSEVEIGSQLPSPPLVTPQTATTLSPEEEHRIDPNDGFYYPKSTFISFYGNSDKWDAALV